jgi:Transmembrane amino acid transporter protein
MAVAAHSAPNYQAAFASYSIPKGPIVTNAGTPPGTNFVTALNGLNQAIYSYGGSMMFCEFMSEMRRPADFWKSLICAQAIIYCCYITFGMVVYHFQGQYSFNPAMQGLSVYNWQTATNIIFLVSSLFATALYTNIGVKVVYINVLQELMHAPPLTTKTGKLIWIGLAPLYWCLAFVISAAIPQFSYVSGLVGAVCILQFTYTFPPILMLGYNIKKYAILQTEIFDVSRGTFTRSDGGIKRWTRGFMANWRINAFNVFFAMGAITTAVLGIYSSIVSLIAGFSGTTVATSFGCTAPV